MITSFGDERTRDLFHAYPSRRVKQLDARLARATVRKLDMLNAAHSLEDLRSPPGNRLEALRGTLAGRYSIRVNQQWRLLFRWLRCDCADVQLVDYHN